MRGRTQKPAERRADAGAGPRPAGTRSSRGGGVAGAGPRQDPRGGTAGDAAPSRGAAPGRVGVPLEERTYDPRREERRRLTRVPIPDDVRAEALDPDVRRDLRGLSPETAELVARHLVAAERLLDEEPSQALVHARAAGALAGRIAVVREAVGLAAYAAQEWADALSELRAARRMSGSSVHLPVLADCERALGRPERALAALDDPAVPGLDQAVRVELVLVVAGARRDLGQADAAVLLLQGPARATTARRPWAARLWYGYADALLGAGRREEAREWFAKVASVDPEGATDADERLLELDGVVFDDSDDASGPEHRDHRGPDQDAAQDAGAVVSPDVPGAGAADARAADEPPLDAAALRELAAGIAPLPAAVEPVRADPAPLPPSPVLPAPVVPAPPASPSSPFLAPVSSEWEPEPERPRRPAVPGVAFVAPDDSGGESASTDRQEQD